MLRISFLQYTNYCGVGPIVRPRWRYRLKSSLQLVLAAMLLFLGTRHSLSQEQRDASSFGNVMIFRNVLPRQKSNIAIAVSTNSAKLDLTQVDCLSLDPVWAYVDGIDHSGDVVMRKAVADYFENVSINVPNCNFSFLWTIVHRKTFAVRYLNKPSSELMAFSICKKRRETNAGRQCISKNIWFFDGLDSAGAEYATGIKAFISSSNADWSIVNVSVKE
jgi:hypothetical protein